MSYFTTFTGIHINPIKPDPQKIIIEDIAHALSFLCRANGHIKHFYSVGQHSVNCCLEAQKRNYSSRVQLGCLLHDASEAYLSDITRPVKPYLKEYLKIENTLQNTIWKKFFPSPLTNQELEFIFGIDDDILSYEFMQLMGEQITENYQNIVSSPDIRTLPFEIIENEILKQHKKLTDEINNHIL